MILYFLFLICLLFILTSFIYITGFPIEVPVDTLKEIPIKHNLQKSNFMNDSDTLKIEILDSNIVNSIQFLSAVFFTQAHVSISQTSTRNSLFESINPDLSFERNPKNKYEFWIFGFHANLDSTRSYGVGRFDYYIVNVSFSIFYHFKSKQNTPQITTI